MCVRSGTPKYRGCTEKIVENAIEEALLYAKYNVVILFAILLILIYI